MKFLLDVCASSRSLSEYLRAEGHDVLSAVELDLRATDARLLEYALQDDRILITLDKDFGELIFVQELPHGPVVRLVQLSALEQNHAIAELLQQYAKELHGAVVVTVTRGRIRVRRRDG